MRRPLLCALVLAAGCRASAPARLPAGALPVPIVQQATEYSCGPASLTAVLKYWDAFDGEERDLYGPLKTTEKDGTEPAALVAVAKARGLAAELKEDLSLADLRAALREGATAIVDFQAWRAEPATATWRDTWESGHYSVLVALDDDDVYLMDPSAGLAYAYVPRAEFLERWHDYEDRDGRPRRNYQHAAVIVKGARRPSADPGAPVRVR